MAVAIGGSGVMGVAIETVIGTYLAPTKFVAFNTESLKMDPGLVERRPVRGVAGLVDLLPGYISVEGDVEFDVTTDVLLMFMVASRATYTKSGTGPYVYTFTPGSAAVGAKTLSISIKRNGEVFGYTGCSVSALTIAIGDDGKMTATASIIGMDETTQAALTPTWPTNPTFYAGMYALQVPTSTAIFDADTFEFAFDDSGQKNSRISTSRVSKFTSFGDNSTSIKLSRDFENRAEYDIFRAATARSITMIATSGADIINLVMGVSKVSSYEINIGGTSDLLRASVEYAGLIDGTGKPFSMVITTTENIT